MRNLIFLLVMPLLLVACDKSGHSTVGHQYWDNNPITIVIGDRAFTTLEDVALTNSVRDSAYPAAIYTLTSTVPHGLIVFSSTGDFTYTPSLNYFGQDTFSYSVEVNGKTYPKVATIEVIPVNDSPVLSDAITNFSTWEDTSLTASLFATDVDSPVLDFQTVQTTTHGLLTLAPSGLFIYTPNPDFNGTDTFQAQVSDGLATSNIVTYSITVYPVNDAPVSQSLSFTVNAGQSYNGNLVATDIDLDALHYSAVTGPTKGTLTVNPTTGQFVYTAAVGSTGLDTFTFKVNDGSLDSNVSTVTVHLNAVNVAPTTSGLSHTVAENGTLNSAVSGSDINGDPLTYSVISAPTHGALTLNSNGTYVYIPATNYYGSDSFTYRANDGTLDSNVSTVSLSVSHVNQAPVANNSSATTNQNAPVSGTLTGYDPDGSAGNTYSVESGPSHGTVVVNPDGTYTYTPNPHYYGPDSFSFRLTDGTYFSIGTVNLNTNHVNEAPTSTDLYFTTLEDTPYSATIIGHDPDGDTLTYSVVTAPTKGTFALDPSSGHFTYTPNLNENGSDSVVFKANDGTTDSSNTHIYITITPVNDAPVWITPTTIALSTNKNVPVTTTVNATDVDGDTVTYAVSSCPNGTCTVSSAGLVTYTPNTGFYGSSVLAVDCSSTGPLSCSPSTTINVTVLNPNTAPVTTDITATMLLKTSTVVIPMTGTDVDGDPLTYSVVSSPSVGTAVVSGTNITYSLTTWTNCASDNGTCAFTGTKLVRYGATPNYVYKVATDGVGCNSTEFSDPNTVSAKTCDTAPVSDSFTIKANDGTADSNVSTVTVNFLDWWNLSWTKREKLLMNVSVSSTLTDFPIMVKLDSTKINYANTKSGGLDIRFIDSNGSFLNYEIESWNPSGTSIVWVKMPSLPANSTNKHIWMYYGNPAATDYQNKNAVWSNGYVGVWHMAETSGLVKDSTVNANDGTVVGTLTRTTSTGPLGNSYSNGAAASCIQIPHSASQALSSTVTMETWAKNTTGGTRKYFIQKDFSASSTYYTAYGLGATTTSTKLFTKTTNSTTFVESTITASKATVTNTWNYHVASITGPVSGAHSYALYTDGSKIESSTTSGLDAGPLYNGSNWQNLNLMGDCVTDGFVGDMDEVRISNVIRSDDWVKMQYVSMSDGLMVFLSEQTQATAVNGNAQLIRILANTDDGIIVRGLNQIFLSGYYSSGVNWTGEGANQDAWAFMRFKIPLSLTTAKTITNARLRLHGRTDMAQIWNNASNYIKIYAQDSSNAPLATANNSYPGGGTVTTIPTVINWNNGSLTWNFSDWNTSINVNNLMQDLITKEGGLNSGNYFQLWMNRGAAFNCGSGSYCAAGFDDYSRGNGTEPMILLEWN